MIYGYKFTYDFSSFVVLYNLMWVYMFGNGLGSFTDPSFSKGPMFDSMFCHGNAAAPNYDSKTGLCKCGASGMLDKTSSGCSNSTPFCVNGTCLCSQSVVSYVRGVSQTKGTCHGTNVCLDDGSCVGMNFIISFD